MNRILYLDMLRGFALVCIMLDHMPLSVMSGVTLKNFAVYDAAELFVLISGFLVGMVWLKVDASQGRAAAQWRFARRAIQVWLALVLGSVLLALLSKALFASGLNHTAVWSQYAVWIVTRPVGYVATVAAMWMQPNLLDVLAVYVILLATVPVLVPVLVRWPATFAALSFAVWCFAVPLNAAIPNQRGVGFLFNPFGWQMLFYSGIAIGIFRERIMAVLGRWSIAVTILAVAITLYSLAMVTLWRLGPEGRQLADQLWRAVGSVNKWRLDEVRFVAILAASWLIAVPLSRPAALLGRTGTGRFLATIGRGGLFSFVACVLLSIIGDAVMVAVTDGSAAQRLSVDMGTIAVLWFVSYSWLNRPHTAPRERSVSSKLKDPVGSINCKMANGRPVGVLEDAVRRT